MTEKVREGCVFVVLADPVVALPLACCSGLHCALFGGKCGESFFKLENGASVHVGDQYQECYVDQHSVLGEKVVRGATGCQGEKVVRVQQVVKVIRLSG